MARAFAVRIGMELGFGGRGDIVDPYDRGDLVVGPAVEGERAEVAGRGGRGRWGGEGEDGGEGGVRNETTGQRLRRTGFGRVLG